MSKIGNIIKSKLTKGEDLGEWYVKRLEICLECPLNTANKKNKGIKDFAISAVNLGAVACTLCGCSVKDKTKIETEQCPDKPPRWLAIKPDTGDKLQIEALGNRYEILYDKVGKTHILDIGEVKEKSSTDISVLLKSDIDLLNLIVKPACGCTVANVSRVEEGYKIDFTYNSKKIGSFNKGVRISYSGPNVPGFTILKIKGTAK